jgi:hypothetical protein
MTLEERYFGWLSWLVNVTREDYHKLLKCLYNTEFTYTIDMDGNRESNGIDLRYQFGYEYDIDDREIASTLDNKPCSILEMMIALSQKIEEIMEDPEVGDQTAYWFWKMVNNLGLSKYSDRYWNEEKVKEILDSFLNRKYGPHGEGGLFVFRYNDHDVRDVEIWTQAMWYLEESERR